MAISISKDGVEITNRFFHAIDLLISNGTIRGLKTITSKYNINRWNLLHVREHPDNAVLKPELISILVRDYGISADWILIGRGEIFSPKNR